MGGQRCRLLPPKILLGAFFKMKLRVQYDPSQHNAAQPRILLGTYVASPQAGSNIDVAELNHITELCIFRGRPSLRQLGAR
jgi:hypothetical protein